MLQTQHDGCSLYALHNILGLSPQAIYDISNGHTELSSDTLLIACDVLGVDPTPWLLRVELTRCRSPKRRQILKAMLDRFDAPETRAVAGFLSFFVVGLWSVFPG